MDNEKVFSMSLAKVYPCLVAKAERKGRTKSEVAIQEALDKAQLLFDSLMQQYFG